MLLWFSRLLVLLSLVVLASCSSDSGGSEYPFERSVLELTASKRCSDREVKPGDPCYLLKWRHPIERKNLLRYHVWLDTATVNDTTLTVPQGALEKSIQIAYTEGRGDFDSLDLTSYLGEYLGRDSLHVAIWAEYGDGSDPGAVQRLFLFFGDDVAPNRVQFSDSTNEKSMWLEWIRPTDQVDFYFPSFVAGPIAGYNLHIYSENPNEDLSAAVVRLEWAGRPLDAGDSSLWLRHHRWRNRNDSLVLDTTPSTSDRSHLRLALIDGRGVQPDLDSNRFRIFISGLQPESRYGVSLTVWDSAGNSSGGDADAGGRLVLTTDTIAPLMASALWLRPDSVYGKLPRLDSNRLVLYWPRSVDPLSIKADILLDSALTLPSGCLVGECFREVSSYKVERWDGVQWKAVARAGGLVSEKYQDRFERSADSMKYALDGQFVSDTIRWVVPGDTLILRIRAVDPSGHISRPLIDTIIVSRGVLGAVSCPAGYAPVSRTTALNGVPSTETYCIEKLEHQNAQGFERNVLYGDARSSCQALSGSEGFAGFAVDLCSEDLWKGACTAGGRSTYGTIEEPPFTALEFLFQHCNVGTWDSVSARTLAARDPFCASPDGVRDLPGQLQEWAVGTEKVYDSIAKIYRYDTIPVLKGTSYVLFEGADRTDLAECAVRARPHRVRPRFSEDTVWLYRNGSTVDTVFQRDTSRTLYTALAPAQFRDTLLFYRILHPQTGALLGEDYVDQKEYRRRGGDAWLRVLWTGLAFEASEKRQVLIKGTQKVVTAANFYVEPSIGYRCCARPQ